MCPAAHTRSACPTNAIAAPAIREVEVGDASQNAIPKAAAVVPALEQVVGGFTYFRNEAHEGLVNLAQAAYLALSRITSDTDHWIRRSEERLLQPMLQGAPRSTDRSVLGYLGSVADFGTPAAPHLARWMSGEDERLARET